MDIQTSAWILIGITFSLYIGIAILSRAGFIKDFYMAGGGDKEDWWFGIFPEGFGSFAMFVNFSVSTIISRFFRAPPKKVQKMMENIRIPSGAGKSAHH